MKFGKEKHLEEMLRGSLYINHASFFKKDIEHGMFDVNEGRASFFNLDNGSIQLRPVDDGEWKTLHVQKGNLQSWYSLDELHIFSIFYISTEFSQKNKVLEFSDAQLKMGDFFLMINDPLTFVSRMSSALKREGIDYFRDFVSYYDPNVNHRELSMFHKTLDYSYQNEYRFVLKGKTSNAIRLDIGSIEDIAEIIPTNSVKGIRFKWNK